MAGEWYCQIRGRQTGPLSNEQLQQLADEQRIGPDNLVRSGRDGSWMPARRVEGLFAAGQSAASASRSAVALKTASPLSAGGSAPRRRVAPSNGGSASARVPPPAPSGAVPVAPAAAPSPAAPVAPKPAPIPMPGAAALPGGAPASAVHPDSLPAPRTGGAGKIIAIVLVSVFGVVALLCGGGIAIGYAIIMRADSMRKELAAKIDEEMEKDRRQREAELEQLGAELENGGGKTSGASQTLEQRALGGVKNWHPADRRVRSGRLVFEVVSVQFLSPREPAAEDKQFGGRRVVLIEVSVGNLGRDPVDFTSWSRGGRTSEDHRAVLVDDRERVCSPVNELGEKAELLLAEDQPIETGEAVTDLLVFEAPRGSPEHLRLALPYSNVGRDGYIGFTIPRDMLRPESAGAAVDGAGGTTIPGAGDSTVPDQPPTFEELQKAIEASRDPE